jgi:hypothetical protein
VAVDQEEDPGVEVARLGKPTNPEVGIVPIVRYVQAGHRPQDVRRAPIPVLLDIVGGGDANRRRGLGHFLLILGGAKDRIYFDIHQLLDAKIAEVFRRGVRGAAARDRDRAHQNRHREGKPRPF